MYGVRTDVWCDERAGGEAVKKCAYCGWPIAWHVKGKPAGLCLTRKPEVKP